MPPKGAGKPMGPPPMPTGKPTPMAPQGGPGGAGTMPFKKGGMVKKGKGKKGC